MPTDARQQWPLWAHLLCSIIAALTLISYLEVTPNDFIYTFPRFSFGALFGALAYAIGWSFPWTKQPDHKDFLLWTISGVAFGVVFEYGFRVFSFLVFVAEFLGTGSFRFLSS
jgi:hypothetical protein